MLSFKPFIALREERYMKKYLPQNFLKRLGKNIPDFQETENIIDIAAYAYCDIQEMLKDKAILESHFCAGYLKKGMGINNPNLDKLGLPYSFTDWNSKPNELVKSITETLEGYSKGEFGIVEFLARLNLALKPTKLEMYDDPDIADEVYAYFLICLVDYYVKKYMDRFKDGSSCAHPMSSYHTDHVCIYRKSPGSMFPGNVNGTWIDEAVSEGINEKLSELFFIPRDRLPRKSEVTFASYPPKKGVLDSVLRDDKTKTLRIAVVPFCQKRVTEFPVVLGSLFTVKHSLKDYDKDYKVIAVDLLNAAIKNSCHIVVFPEFMMSQTILDALEDELCRKHNSNEGTENLLLVCAGTRWDESNNNIGTLLSAEGVVLIEKFKTEPYKTNIKGKDYVEYLNDPGRVIQLLDVEGFGRVQLSVCRDVCATKGDSDHNRIFSLFHPDLVLVPAWSGSVISGFAGQFEDMGKKGAVSILGNCCEAITFIVELKKEEAGIKGKEVSDPPPSKKIRAMTGLPDGKGKGKNIKISCEYGLEKNCPVGNCMIIYDLEFPNENNSNTFRIDSGTLDLIGKDGKSVLLNEKDGTGILKVL